MKKIYLDKIKNLKFYGKKNKKNNPVDGYFKINKLKINVKNEIYKLLKDEKNLAYSDRKTYEWYENNFQDYDSKLHYTFKALCSKESLGRIKILEKIPLKGRNFLEVGCGTGRDSINILKYKKYDNYYFQDFHFGIINIFKNKINKLKIKNKKINLFQSDASNLPFEDNKFDTLFHFGSLNTFDNIKKCLLEFVRVTKHGGYIIVGDESIAPWLRNKKYSKILMHSNPHFKYNLPLEYLPEQATNVEIKYLFKNTFYLIKFKVNKIKPRFNFNFKIISKRGGTYLSRYKNKF